MKIKMIVVKTEDKIKIKTSREETKTEWNKDDKPPNEQHHK
jgi:hypothetical protein